MSRDRTPEDWAELYRQVFEVDVRGAAILEHMVQLFSRPAVISGGIDAVLQTYHRMGSNNVVQHIVQQINRANGLNEQEQE